MGTSDIPEIRGRLTLDDSQVAEVMAKVGTQAEGMGKQLKTSGEYGEAGMRILGASAHEAAQSLGLPGPIARRLSSQIEDTVMSFGKFATGVGIATVVVTAGIAIYKHFHDQLVANREEILKNSASAESWIKSAYGAQAQTDEMGKATARLTEAERILNNQRLRQGIGEEKRILTEQEEKLEKLAHTYNVYNEQIETAERQGALMLPLMEKIQKNRDIEYTNLKDDLNVRKARIGVMQQEIAISGQHITGSDVYGPSNKEYADYLKQQGVLETAQLIANNTNEITLFDMQWAQKLDYLRASKATEYTIEYEYSMMIIQLREKEKAADMMRLQAARQGVGSLAQTFEIMSSLGGAHARKYFSLWKTMALADATLAGLSSILNSYNFGSKIGGPILGGVFAGIAAMATGAQIAKIRSTEFTGGGADIGMGATGTYDANPTTGLPTSQPAAAPSLTIIINGREINIGDMASGVAEEFYRNNGSIGGFSVAVGRSA